VLSILCRVIGHAAKMARCLAEQGISNFLQVTNSSMRPCPASIILFNLGRDRALTQPMTKQLSPRVRFEQQLLHHLRTPQTVCSALAMCCNAAVRSVLLFIPQPQPLHLQSRRATCPDEIRSLLTEAGHVGMQVSQEARKALGPTAASDSNWFTGGSVIAWPGEKVRWRSLVVRAR